MKRTNNRLKDRASRLNLYRATLSFTRAERARYKELLFGRNDTPQIRDEAADIVLRETAQGALNECCARCVAGIPDSAVWGACPGRKAREHRRRPRKEENDF